jgi:hypothetical protein
MEPGCGGRPAKVLRFVRTRSCDIFGVDFPWLFCISIIGLQARTHPPHCIALYYV